MAIIELMILVFLINFPFGYWKFNTARFSRKWMMAVHIPVPFVIILRIFSGFGWKIVPFLMLSFAAGQFAGGKFRNFMSTRW